MIDIPFETSESVAYGIVEALEPEIRRITARNAGPFTYTGTGTYIVGRERVAVIDPGPPEPAHVDALLQGIRGESVSHILITHHHIDHSGATRILKERTGAPVIGFKAAPSIAKASHPRVEEDFDPTCTHDQTVSDGDIIEGKGWSLECVHTPGHTADHVCYAFKEQSALFCGDHIMGWSTTVISPPDGNMTEYLKSLGKTLRREELVFYPTHGVPITQPGNFVRALIQHREHRIAQVLELLKIQERSALELTSSIYPEIYPGLLGAAAQSTLATLIHLADNGYLASVQDPTRNSVFRLVQ